MHLDGDLHIFVHNGIVSFEITWERWRRAGNKRPGWPRSQVTI